MNQESEEFVKSQMEDFRSLIKDYEVFSVLLKAILSKGARELGINAIVQSRAKDPVSFLNKCYKKQMEMDGKGIKVRRPFAHSFTDLCGARVIVEYRAQAEAVCQYIRRHFEIDERNSVNPKTALRTNEFSYRSDHLVVALRPGEFPDVLAEVRAELAKNNVKAGEEFDRSLSRLLERRAIPEEVPNATLPSGPKFKAEIQIKTLLEYAWSSVTHDRIYKGEVTPPPELAREVNRVSALLEEADEVFARVVRHVEAFGSNIRKHLGEKERQVELRRLEFAVSEFPGRRDVAIEYARMLADKREWEKAAKTLAPHVERWMASIEGRSFTQSFDAWDKETDSLKRKRAESDLSCMRDPHASALLMELGWARAHLPGINHNAKRTSQELLRKAARLDHLNAEAHRRLGRVCGDPADQVNHYEAAFRMAPSDPAILQEFLHAKLLFARTLNDLPLMRASLLGGIETCRRRIEIGVDLPATFFEIAEFQLLLEQGREGGPETLPAWADPQMMRSVVAALNAYAKAADLTPDGGDLPEYLERQRSLRGVIGRRYLGSDWAIQVLTLLHAAKAWDQARQTIADLKKSRDAAKKKGEPTDDVLVEDGVRQAKERARKLVADRLELLVQRPKLNAPLVIFVGGSDDASRPLAVRFKKPIEDALRRFHGTIVGGGATAGISGIAGSAPLLEDSAQKLAYLSHAVIKENSQLLNDPQGKNGYKLIPVEGSGFTPQEYLELWTDILVQGVDPAEVMIVAMNGGLLSGFELRLSLSLGALVGAVRESGGSARELLDDPDWKGHPRLLDIPDDEQAIKALIDSKRTVCVFEPEIRDLIARELHNERAAGRRGENLRPADRPWEDLGPFFQQDVRDRIGYWQVLLETAGMTLFKGQLPEGAELVTAFTDDERETMAEMEHARWIVNRLSAGQRHGAEKKDEKTHPDIVPWRELGEEQKEKDRKYVDQILRAGKYGCGIGRKIDKAKNFGTGADRANQFEVKNGEPR